MENKNNTLEAGEQIKTESFLIIMGMLVEKMISLKIPLEQFPKILESYLEYRKWAR